jgi:hypothetical protein
MKTYNELAKMTPAERFQTIFVFVTTELKNDTVKDICKKALKGHQDSEVLSFQPAFILSELAVKGFIPAHQEQTLCSMF